METVALLVYKGPGGFIPDGSLQNISCAAREVKRESLSLRNQADCGPVTAGDGVPTNFQNSVKTVMLTTEMGPVWVDAEGYDNATTGFLAVCNGCCGT
jgi:hypothetical protein